MARGGGATPSVGYRVEAIGAAGKVVGVRRGPRRSFQASVARTVVQSHYSAHMSLGFPPSWCPAAYSSSLVTVEDTTEAVNEAIDSATTCIGEGDPNLRPLVLQLRASDVETLMRVSSLICRFVEGELDYTSSHKEGLGRIAGSALSSETHPRLGAEVRRSLDDPEARALLGRAVERLLVTSYLGSDASGRMLFGHSEHRLRPLDVGWPLWIACIPGSPPKSWPDEVQAIVGVCSDTARGMFIEIARELGLGRRAMRKDNTELLGYMSTLYTQAGAALAAVVSPVLDEQAAQFSVVH